MQIYDTLRDRARLEVDLLLRRSEDLSSSDRAILLRLLEQNLAVERDKLESRPGQ